MLKETAKHLLVAAALVAPGMALAGGRISETPSARRIYDATQPDGIAPGQEGTVGGEGVTIAGGRYDPAWPDGVAPGQEASDHGRGVELSGVKYDATWPDGIAPGGEPEERTAPEEPVYAGTVAAR